MWKLFLLLGLSISMELLVGVSGQGNSRKLCQRIASQCRSTCQTFWDECHERPGSVMMGGTYKPEIIPLSSTTESDSTLVPIILGQPSQRECIQYRDPCDIKHRCCKPYNCRFQSDGSGVGICF